MDIFASNIFIKYELIFLGMNLIYIGFYILHSLFHSYLKIRSFVGKKKTIEKIIEEQEEKLIQEKKITEDSPELQESQIEKESEPKDVPLS